MTKRINIPNAVRQYVLARNNYQCQMCGCQDKSKLQVDHIIPLALNGSNDISNLQVLCLTCNVRKKDRRDTKSRRLFDY